MSNEINPMAFFQEPSVADLRLLACPGAEELTELIDRHLVEWAKSAGVEKDSFIIPCECPRFQSGDAKGLVRESVRGDDIFIVIDPGNYSVTYNLFGYENHLSPDDHFANLKRMMEPLPNCFSIWLSAAANAFCLFSSIAIFTPVMPGETGW